MELHRMKCFGHHSKLSFCWWLMMMLLLPTTSSSSSPSPQVTFFKNVRRMGGGNIKSSSEKKSSPFLTMMKFFLQNHIFCEKRFGLVYWVTWHLFGAVLTQQQRAQHLRAFVQVGAIPSSWQHWFQKRTLIRMPKYFILTKWYEANSLCFIELLLGNLMLPEWASLVLFATNLKTINMPN